MLRPLVTALIEYVLAFLVFKYGKVHKGIFSAILFLLATYQLGELIVFLTNGNIVGFKIAYIATTLLPPLGVLLIQRITKKKLGYLFFQILGLGFALYLLIIPEIALKFEFGPFCIRVFQYETNIQNYWPYYYQGTLLYTIAVMAFGIFSSKSNKVRALLKNILLAYFAFDLLTFVIMYFVPWLQYSSASLMCALALISSFIFAKISLAENLKIIYKHILKYKALPY